MSDVASVHEAVWRELGVRVTAGEGMVRVAEDCLFVLPGVAVRGFEKARPYFQAYLAAYPDTEKRVSQVLSDERTVVVRSVVTGTNDGTLATDVAKAPPTGRRVEWDVVEWLVLEDGLVVEWRLYQDPTPFIDALRGVATSGLAERSRFETARACVADAVMLARLESPLARQPEVLRLQLARELLGWHRRPA